VKIDRLSHGDLCECQTCVGLKASPKEKKRAIPFSRGGTTAEPMHIQELAAPPPSALGGVSATARASPGTSPGTRGGVRFIGGTRQGESRAKGRRMGATARAAAAREQQQRRRFGSKFHRCVFEPRVDGFDPSRLRTAIQVGQQSASNLRVANGRERKSPATGGGASSKGSSSTRSRSIRLVTNHRKYHSSPEIVMNRNEKRGRWGRRDDPKSARTPAAGGHQRLWGPPDGGRGAAPVEQELFRAANQIRMAA
jgi:hypothetical protein